MLVKDSIPCFLRVAGVLGAAAAVTACSAGGGSSASSILPSAPDSAAHKHVSIAATPSQFAVVQTAEGGSTYKSTVNVRLGKAPAAGDTLVLLFEDNKTSAFPYSGQVVWPASETGSQWSYDGTASGTAILHHVVQSGETGSYTLNVGGSGNGWADYMVAEIRGANATNPVNKVLPHSVSAGTSTFTLGYGITPTAAGTFPVVFFSAHQSGKTWNSVSTGWTIAARNADYTEMLAYGPVQSGTAAVNVNAQLSSPSSYAGAADAFLLNPASSSNTVTATPAPAATATPMATPNPVSTATPAPVATPVATTSGYTYHGCPLYAANDWLTTNLLTGGSSYVPSTVDPNSAAIISNLNAAYPNGNFAANVDASLEAVNLVPSTVATPQIGGLSYGFDDDPYGDDPSPHSIPLPSHVYQEGTNGCSSSSGDCHVIVLDTSKCVEWETYNWDAPSWNGSTYTAKAGFVHNLRHSFNDQYSLDTVGPTAAHTPLLGTTDWGEEASLSSIPHILGFFLGKPGVADGGYVAPARGGMTCTSYCNNKLPYGARLRLHSSYSCPSASTYPQANLICNQMKTYGIIFDDTTGLSSGFGVRLGESTSGSNPWRSSDYDQLLSKVKITDFDVMTLGTIH